MRATRTCEELGLCQNLKNPCDEHCQRRHYFAPGVIEGMTKKRQARAQMRILVRWMLMCVGLMATVMLVGFVAGLAAGYLT